MGIGSVCDNSPRLSPRSWQQAVRAAVRDVATLCSRLGLDAGQLPLAEQAWRQFPLFVPEEFLQRMTPGDPHDPLLRQVLPLAAEDHSPAGFVADPLHEDAAQPTPGLLHKYEGRALLITTGACAIHCRYCFRRHFPYSEAPRGLAAWGPALAALAADDSIHEVLLSGGDPLMLADETLAALVGELAAIGHLQRLRVHTRLPIVIPQRVNDELLAWLTGTRLTPIVVLHANHARELDDDVAAAVRRLRAAGVLLFNQAVLLAGVNNEVQILADLSQRLIELGVAPYYLHQLDRVAGAAHFEVSVEDGLQIMDDLRSRLPGYAVPRYVREEPGAAAKSPLG